MKTVQNGAHFDSNQSALFSPDYAINSMTYDPNSVQSTSHSRLIRHINAKMAQNERARMGGPALNCTDYGSGECFPFETLFGLLYIYILTLGSCQQDYDTNLKQVSATVAPMTMASQWYTQCMADPTNGFGAGQLVPAPHGFYSNMTVEPVSYPVQGVNSGPGTYIGGGSAGDQFDPALVNNESSTPLVSYKWMHVKRSQPGKSEFEPFWLHFK